MPWLPPRPRVRGGDTGSFFTGPIGVAGGAEPEERDADADEEDEGTILRGLHELSRRRETAGMRSG